MESAAKKQKIDEEEETFAFLKQDCIERCLIPQVLERIQQKGLTIIDMVMVYPTLEIMQDHYKEHSGKDFYDDLCVRMSKGKILLLRLRGKNAIANLRQIVGSTNCSEKGTIRGDFGIGVQSNIIHASSSLEDAARELRIWGKYFQN